MNFVHLDIQGSFEIVFETVLSVVLLGRNEICEGKHRAAFWEVLSTAHCLETVLLKVSIIQHEVSSILKISEVCIRKE